MAGTVYCERHALEASVCEIGGSLAAHVCRVCPHAKADGENTLVAVITFQQSTMDLVNFGPDVDAEKDRLLENVCWSLVCAVILCAPSWPMCAQLC